MEEQVDYGEDRQEREVNDRGLCPMMGMNRDCIGKGCAWWCYSGAVSYTHLSVEDFPLYRAIDNEPPGSEYYLHRDFRRVVRVATRDEFLHFANHLPEIIRAFEVKEDAIIEELRDAFERLRKLAEEG